MDPYAPSTVTHFQGSALSSDAQITQGVIDQLARTKPWVRFISVMMFIGAGLLLLLALIIGLSGVAGLAGGANGSSRSGLVSGGIGMGIMIFYGIFGILYIFPALKLWKYASRIGDLTRSFQWNDLESALSEQRSFWKFVGIAMILMVVLYGLLIVFAFFVPAMAPMKR